MRSEHLTNNTLLFGGRAGCWETGSIWQIVIIGETLPAQPFCICGCKWFRSISRGCLDSDMEGASSIGVPRVGKVELE